jgi:hypothetical protein
MPIDCFYREEQGTCMETHDEKRRYPRYDHRTPMNLCRMDNQDECCYAEMKDYGQGGMSMLTNEKLVVGHLVYLEMNQYDQNAKGPEAYKGYRGYVKWASRFSATDRDANGPHLYGVEFSEPVCYQC